MLIEKKMKLNRRKVVLTILICIVFSLNSFYAVSAITGYDIPDDDYSAELSGDVLSFSSEYDGETFVISDVQLEIEEESLEIYNEITLTSEGDMSSHIGKPPQEFVNDVYLYNSDSFLLRLSDMEGKFFLLENKGYHNLHLTIEVGADIQLESWTSEGNLLFLLSNQHRISLNKTSGVDITVDESYGEPVIVFFNIPPGGEVTSAFYKRAPQDELSPSRYVGRIDISETGRLEYEKYRPGLSVELQNAQKGSVEMTLSNDFSGYEQIHMVFDRDLIGSDVQDLSDIMVSVDGDELEYMSYKDFHADEESEGYYVNMTDGETHVFVRMHFSERNLRVYERSAVTPAPVTNNIYGLLIGILVVIVGAAVLFYKK